MKTWKNATIEELDIKATANGAYAGLPSDGTWVQHEDGKFYLIGGGANS